MKINIAPIIKELEKKEQKLDKIIPLGRETIRLCAKGIKLIHNGQTKSTDKLVSQIRNNIKKLRAHNAEFRHYNQVEQEFAEFIIFISIIKNKKIPTYKEMNIDNVPYLNGMMDCVGELRRYMLDSIRKIDLKTAERMFKSMEELYDATLELSFSKSILPNFKPKQDVARRQIELARSELTNALIVMRKNRGN